MTLVIVSLLLLMMPVAWGQGTNLQVHLGPGMDATKMNVGWTTPSDLQDAGTDTVKYGLSPLALTQTVTGNETIFLDGAGFRKINMHRATMTDLAPSTRYYYQVSSSSLTSAVFSFKSLPKTGPLKRPLKMIVFGDMGADNPQSLPAIIRDVQTGQWDLSLGIGDYAYDMYELNGSRADDYFAANEPVYAELPSLVCPGNHESSYNFQHYTYRWNTNPVNTGPLPPAAGKEVAGQPNNWWFSYDVGNVHVLSYSTEVFFDYIHMLPSMLAWIQADLDLANRNRQKIPWIIMIGHRPNYCSCDGDCDGAATTTRTLLEPLMFRFGVDLMINAHEHNYERLYATYKSTHVAGNGSLVEDPQASVYIITGDAGNSEGHEPFTRDAPEWSAVRSNTFGYSRLTVHNDTHLYWEQVMTDSGQPATDYGKVIDTFWLIQHSHGPFKAHVQAAPTGDVRPKHTNFALHRDIMSELTGRDGPNSKHKTKTPSH